MSELTFIKGKDACLEESIDSMQTQLKSQGFSIQEASWLNPAKNIFSLHINEATCPGLFTNGKGASRKACLASALGEYLERLSTNYFFSDYYIESAVKESDWLYYPDEKAFDENNIEACLNETLWRFYDPEESVGFNELLSFNDSVEKVRAIPLVNQRTQEIAYFPMNLMSNIYASNGLSAGNTALEAQVQGLSEIFERWVKNKILRENLCVPEVPQSVVDSFPTIAEAVKSLEEAGLKLSIRDASLGGRYPVINVTLFDQSTGQCFASFGAHPIFEVALERTLTESLQGRHLQNLDGFQAPVFDEVAIAEDENIENHFIDSSGLIHDRFISHDYDFDFVHWDFSGTTESQWEKLHELVLEQNTDAYVANYTHCGFQACRIIVPGMSEVYPVTELLDSNQNEGRLLREAIFKAAEDNEFASLVELIDLLGFSDHQGVASLIGLMPDKGSFWAQLKVCDLRFWALLASGQKEEALDALHELIYFVNPDNSKILLYKAIQYALEWQEASMNDESTLSSLFGEKVAKQAWKAINAEEVFAGEILGKAIFDQSKQHQAMLAVYARLHEAKAKNMG